MLIYHSYICLKHFKLLDDLLKSITYQNSKDLITVLTYLEDSFEIEYKTTSMNNIDKFISSLHSWSLIVQFSRAHNTELSSWYLKQLAINNCWFEFILVVHIFHYPLEQVIKKHIKPFFFNQHMSYYCIILFRFLKIQ